MYLDANTDSLFILCGVVEPAAFTLSPDKKIPDYAAAGLVLQHAAAPPTMRRLAVRHK